MIPYDLLFKLYSVERKTDKEIARLLNLNKQTVYLTRKKYGICAIQKHERNSLDISNKQNQIILGGMLGDGHVSNGIKNKKRCQSYLEFKHGPKQKEYLYWKYNQLINITKSEPTKVNGQYRFRSFSHEYFSKMRDLWYPNGVKIVYKDSESLEPLGLAVWYMDDGKNDGNGSSISLCSCSFSLKDNDYLIDILRQNFSIHSHTRIYNGYPSIFIDLSYRSKFLSLIEPYCIDCVKYKFKRNSTYYAIP